MARTVRSSTLESREARRRLPAQKKPYYVSLDQGQHLGYYKGARGGTWSARCFIGDGRYKEARIGIADDKADDDGATVFSYSTAQKAARHWCGEQLRLRDGLEPQATGPYTVRDAITDYLSWYQRRGGKSHGATKNAADVHILPVLGDTRLDRLTPKKIRDWHHDIAEADAMVRRGIDGTVSYRKTTGKNDEKRRRQATANRILTVLKAALNHAWREGKVASDDPWRRVQPFQSVDAPVVRYLTAAECKRLVNAASEDFRPLAQAALFTGCRYGEMARMEVADFNPDSDTLTVRASKSGKPRHVVLTEEARKFFDEHTAGRASDEPMFMRADGKRWGPSHQQRPLALACKNAKISPAISFHVLRHTHGSLLAMQGVPMPVIARQLGHADTRMTEKHYAHLSPDYVADTIRAHFPILNIVDESSVSRLR